ncbi:hypothetical protein G6F22_014437 [Rhizopus arrhizus]|nr:hypothetical protein G6F22_014437 [Rhizopus arrhizus]
MRYHHHLWAATTITHRVTEHLAGTETAVVGGQVDAFAQLAHHRITRQGDAQGLGQLFTRRLQSLWCRQVAQAVVAQSQQRGGTDLFDALERIGDGRRRIAHLACLGQPGARSGEIPCPRGVLGTTDQPALGGRQSLPRTPIALIQRQRLTEVADGAVTILANPVRAQVLFAGAVVRHHALRGLDPPLQCAHFLVLRRQAEQHQCLAAGLGQCLALLQRPYQQRIGLLLQALAGALQALPGLAVIRILLLYRQPQGNGSVGILVEPAFGKGLLGRAPQLRKAASLPVHPRRRPVLHVLGGILTGNGHAALPGRRCQVRRRAFLWPRRFVSGALRRRRWRRCAAGQGNGQGGAQRGRQRKTQAGPPSARTRTDVRLFSPA